MFSSLLRLPDLRCASLLAITACLPQTAHAQSAPVPSVSVPVVQQVPQKSAGMRLNDALFKLAKSPQDVAALIDAGEASLDLGDSQAAVGFFQRALQIQPGNAQVKADLAGAYVQAEDPFTAIELFDEAEKAGPIAPARLADRGLAFDMVGDNQTAQFYYRQSLEKAPSDETLRRLALSQAISRDRKGMDQTLAPLLQKQDKAAWRTRAFGLAILGQTDEAEAIARQTMSAEMATAITAYLRYMPRLTAAQQAAAGNLGRFPRAAEIGHDDPRLAFYSRSRVQVAAATPPAAAPTPTKGKPDKTKPAKGKPARDAKAPATTLAAAPVPPPEVQVARETTTTPPQLAVATPPKPVPTQPKPVPAPPKPVPSAPPPAPAPAPTPTPGSAPTAASSGFTTINPPATTAAAGFDLGKSQPATSIQPTPPSATPTPPPPAPSGPTSIDEAFAGFDAPSAKAEVQSGAVDVRKIKPATPVAPEKPAPDKTAADKAAADKAGKGKPPAKDSKPAAPSHPSRIWVQLATGRDKSALGFDWRKLAKDSPALFKGLSPYVTPWGQANRLLAGPFDTAKEANAFLAQLKKAGTSGAFIWTSPAGQVVTPLGGK